MISEIDYEQLVRKVINESKHVSDILGRKPVIMEVCGTHTVAIMRSGIHNLLEDVLDLRSGPGCPVCVTPIEDVDTLVSLARGDNTIIATFGDMFRVPGSNSSLEREKAMGKNVKVIYSPYHAITLAQNNPGVQVIFAGIGFETTAPIVGLAIGEAQKRSLHNFSVFSMLRLMPPVLKTLFDSSSVNVNGLILPGHVSAITGRASFEFLAKTYSIPCVVAGFEPFHILRSFLLLLEMLKRKDPKVLNGYVEVVREDGNPKALQIIENFFYYTDVAWRGLGMIPLSGLGIQDPYYDASVRFRNTRCTKSDIPHFGGCRCEDVLRGVITPLECALFGTTCNPVHPLGPCMVSEQGACFAYYN